MLFSKATSFARLYLLLLASLFLLLVLACDGLPIGKPGTSAPRSADDMQPFWEACEDKRAAIGEWADGRKEKVAEKWMDGEITGWRAGLDIERIDEEAEELDDRLMDNCRAKSEELWPMPDFPSSPKDSQ